MALVVCKVSVLFPEGTSIETGVLRGYRWVRETERVT